MPNKHCFPNPLLPMDGSVTSSYNACLTGSSKTDQQENKESVRGAIISVLSNKGFHFLFESGVVALKRAGRFGGSQQTQLTWSWCTW